MSVHYNVDPHNIFVVGHSNGAFMAHHLACRIGGRVAAMLTLAGENWVDPAQCPAGPGVSLADVHGDADGTVDYTGGTLQGLAYLGARASTEVWAARGGCSMNTDTSAPPINVDGSIPGNETAIERWTGCPTVDVELWTIHGGSHIPDLTEQWPTQVWTFLSAHPKP
jgi:polyhydroxybutyrate depolymerase